jgi:MFS transporter, FHS family, L-fucose permease
LGIRTSVFKGLSCTTAPRSAAEEDMGEISTMPESRTDAQKEESGVDLHFRFSIELEHFHRSSHTVMDTSPAQAANNADVIEGKRDTAQLFPSGQLLPFVLVTALFFLWGIPNNLNDVLIRQFMKSFAISRFQAGLVQFAFYLGYFVLAIPAAIIMRKLGYKAGFVIGLFLFSLGTLLFWPAAVVGRYGFFLFALFVIASGLSFLETASNPFIAQLGDPASSERRLNFSQAFNPLGSITGVLMGTVFIFSGVELAPQQIQAMKAQHLYDAYLRTETMRVVKPYLVLSAIAIFWALLILRTKFPSIQSEHETSGDRGHFRELFRYRHFWMAVLAQFMYVGAQVGTWSYFIQYVQEFTHEPEKVAGYFLTGTLAAFGVGRFSSAWLMRFVEPSILLGYYAIVNVFLVVFGIVHPGWGGLWALFATSFFMSLMFPTIFALGLKGLGPNTKIGGSLLVMAIVGGAILTPLMGLIAEARHSIAPAYVVPLVAYALIGGYAFAGAKMRRTTESLEV